ncbi:MAG: bile acid:sodium symporter, partial [Muribaculaceae bacterium]|nr:bile acid:sodium symporter [Muribaculaceae bacterium]
AQGVMMCVLCPVASSVTVVASMLGANAIRTTTYTVIGNLMVAIVAPVYISIFRSVQNNYGIGSSFLLILGKIASVIALPFFVVLLIQYFSPGLNSKIAKYKQLSFYLWAFALLVTIGHTADSVVTHWNGNYNNLLWLGAASLLICAMQFGTGRLIGKRYGDRIAGGQLLAQKNSAMGIWMLNTFMNPVASVALACYSIWQNIFNSWQIYRMFAKKNQ